jgi:Tfp pilus assembly protein PilX
MSLHLHTPPRRQQRGLGTLAVSLLLLLTITLVALYLNRGVLFEQRSSANQARSTLAQEVAEAGLEWATGMLNAPFDIGADCGFLTTTNQSFRRRYVQTRVSDPSSPTTDVAPRTDIFPGCKITSAGLSCNCPSAAGSASLGSAVQASFTVAFEAVAGDPEAVSVTAWGCSDQAAACTGTGAAAAEASARATVILKMRPMLRAMPSAPLTCGTSCQLGGSYNVVNTDVNTNGILVNAGTTITQGPGVSYQTLAGQPAANALVGADGSLAALSSSDATCSNSNMFKAYFGSTLQQYANSPGTKVLSCGSAADCKSKIMGAYNDGWRNFYFATDLHLSGNDTLGSSADPVTIVTPNAIDINGTWDIYGLIFSNDASWNDLGTGTANIHGAQISCAAYRNNGNGTVSYDPEALKNARRNSALMVRVPGSWRDWRADADTLP